MSESKKTILVTGAGGFIGGHMVKHLLSKGEYLIRAVDIKNIDEWHQKFDNAENISLDLSLLDSCQKACNGVSDVFNFACDMGGMGFIERFKAKCMLSVLINTHLLMAAKEAGVCRYFYASSACVYAQNKQCTTQLSAGLKEEDAYPAMPEDGYGWEKLFSERMCRHFREDFGLETRIARYHNIYGPNGTWCGGREKAPAAMCRKVISAQKTGGNKMNIWGDGEQTRSFTYIDDCIDGTLTLMYSDVTEPLNIGSSEMVTINHLARLCEGFAGIELELNHLLDKPLGVRGRSSNNEKVKESLNWLPGISLAEGMKKTYEWIKEEMKNSDFQEDPED